MVCNYGSVVVSPLWKKGTDLACLLSQPIASVVVEEIF